MGELNYFGARFYDPVLGIWLGPDQARQFNNPYNGMGGDPVNGIDPDGNCVFTPVDAAICIGAAVGAVVGGGTYAATIAFTDAEWDSGDFGMAMGMGAIGGAISGGVGSLGTSMATNMAWGTLGNMASYTTTSTFFGDGPTMAGYGGAIVGGLAGGLLPSYQGLDISSNTGVDITGNIIGELAYSGTKGAAVGALSGGIGASIQAKSWDAFGAGARQGAFHGAIGGMVGAGLKIAAFGAAYEDWEAEVRVQHAEKHLKTDLGIYKPTARRGFLINGMSIGKNAVKSYGGEKGKNVAVEEWTHQVQQAKQGPMQYMSRGLSEQVGLGRDCDAVCAYNFVGTNEYQANVLTMQSVGVVSNRDWQYWYRTQGHASYPNTDTYGTW